MAVYTPNADQVQQELLDSLDYEETGDVAKAKRVITLCKQWLLLRPDNATQQGVSISLNVQSVQEELKRAQDYVGAMDNSPANSSRQYMSVANFRG